MSEKEGNAPETHHDPRFAPDIEGGSTPIVIQKTRFKASGQTTSIYACGPVRATLAEAIADVVHFLRSERDGQSANGALESTLDLAEGCTVLQGEKETLEAQLASARAAVAEYERVASEWARKLQEAAQAMGRAERLQAAVEALLDGMTPYSSALEMNRGVDGEELVDELWAAVGREGKWMDASASPLKFDGPTATMLWLHCDRTLAAKKAMEGDFVSAFRDWLQREHGPAEADAFDQAVIMLAEADRQSQPERESQESPINPEDESQEVRRGRKRSGK